MKWKLLGLLGLIFAALLVVFLQDEQNRYVVTSSKGRITEGERFGVSIGDRIDVARHILENKRFLEVITPQQAHEMNYPYKDEHVFLGQSWRGGVVWLKQSGGVVTEIGWRYDLGAKLP